MVWSDTALDTDLERDSFAQAKAELEKTANSGIDYLSKLMLRAQQIKLEKMGKK